MQEIWLAIDLTQKKSTAAICKDGKTDEGVISETGDHSENLLTQLEILLKKNEVELKDVSRFLTLEGPGSFTGMRIAFASLKAFFFSAKKPVSLLQGAEIKLLKSGESQKDVWVVQHLNAKRYHCVNIFRNENKIVMENDLDLIQPKHYSEISARDLIEFYSLAKRKKDYVTAEDIIQMSPQYL